MPTGRSKLLWSEALLKTRFIINVRVCPERFTPQPLRSLGGCERGTDMSLALTEKLIQRQINHWNRFKEYLKDEDEQCPVLPGPVITISRMSGSGGRTLATGLAERLGITIHDQSLVDKISKDRNLAKSVVAQLDETAINQAELWVKGVLNQRIFLKDEYHMALVSIVTKLAAAGNVIFLGRGANLILGHNATLRIRVVASRPTRLARITQRTGLSRAEARALLQVTDRNRKEFIRKVFKVDPNAPEHFDLVLNSDRLTPEGMLEMATLALIGARNGGRPRIHSQV
jgi:cytidylate kinase